MGVGRDRRVPQPPGLTGEPPFWAELSAAAKGVPGARLTAHEGFARLELAVPEAPAGLSVRTAELVAAHPGGVVVIDVRNRQWLAMAVDLLAATRSG